MELTVTESRELSQLHNLYLNEATALEWKRMLELERKESCKLTKTTLLNIVMWRLSIILWIPVAAVTMLLIAPVRWVITGEYRFNIIKNNFMYLWTKKIGVL